jgi:SAM-dependent methyltransferase
MLTTLQYKILKAISPGEPDTCSGAAYAGKSKLAILLGEDFLQKIKGKAVIDFGCGEGAEAVEMAQNGAKEVFGLDIRHNVLESAKLNAQTAGVQNICRFGRSTDEPADVIVSLDSFEHFGDTAHVLSVMASLLRAHGEVIASFGPTWYHPLGGHLFSVFPWAHLVFSEKALIRWRSDFKTDGATKFGEVAGGLNQMTIARFEQFVANSPFRMLELDLVPIRKLTPLHNRLTREFTTALVRCRMRKK